MIKEIELINFENHEHTILKDFHNGFNLLWGSSMIGKTSIIRAIKLVCYGEFDKDSIAVGENTCSVKLTTEKGTVTVVKGDGINKWIVEPISGKKQEFNNPGKKILPEVTQITGLSIVSLGDIDLKINVMNQLDGHFLMAKIGDKDSSGSLRAQIIDEISGLIGVEPLIKEICTDNLRLTKEIKQVETEKKSLQSEIINDLEIIKEKTFVEEIENKYNTYISNKDTLEKIKEENNKYKKLIDLINLNEIRITLPKIDFSSFNVIEIGILKRYRDLKKKSTVSSNIDFSKISFDLFNLNDACSLLEKYKKLEIKKYKKVEKINFNKFNNIKDNLLKSYKTFVALVEKLNKELDIIKNEKEIYKEKINALLLNISVCPLTNNPISDKCKKINL